MKRFINVLLIAVCLALVLPVCACTQEIGIIEGELPPYEIPYNTPIGAHPDLEGLKIDGDLSDAAWGSVEWVESESASGAIHSSFKAIMTEKGVAFAFRTDDPSVFWIRREDVNTGNTRADVTFSAAKKGGINLTYKIDAFYGHVHHKALNVKTSYDGDLSSGKVTNFAFEGFVAWSALLLDEKPDEIDIKVQYYHKAVKVADFSIDTIQYAAK